MSNGDSPSSEARPELRIGSYRVLEPLGSGGMSSVFKAAHVETGHVVALKVLPRTMAKNPTLLQRFLREAKSAEALEHPNIVSIFDRGVDQGRHYLVLEYVEGGDLHDRIKKRGPLELHEAVAVVKAVAEGLAFASTRGLIHRDIKPANLLLMPTGRVKIIDLGLALQSENDDERVTREGTTVGTVDFMSPEQARDSRATSERSDIYSLGCTFYFLLTGSPPFPGGDVADKLTRHCLKPAPDVKLLRAGVPAPLSLLIQRMMAKRPEQRFQSYAELVDELDVVPSTEETPQQEPVYALIDDDEPAAGTTAEEDVSAEAPLDAILEEDDDDDLPTPNNATALRTPGASGVRPKPDRDVDRTPSLANFTLAELAAISDEPPARPIKPRSPATKRPEPPVPEPPSVAILDDEEEPYDDAEAEASLGSRRYEDASKKWIVTCALFGVGFFLLVIGAHQLIRATSDPDPTIASVEEQPPPPDESSKPAEVVEEPPPPTPPPSIPLPVASIAKPVAIPQPKAEPPTPAEPVQWVEPADPALADVAEEKIDPAVETPFLPEWARGEVPEKLPGKITSVRRVADPRLPGEKPSLSKAFGEVFGGGTVEIRDDGPFFEDDLQTFGESLLVRTQPEYRPIIHVDPPNLSVVARQAAVFELVKKTRIFDGLDIVVDVDNLPHHQTALFFCQGANLTFRNCTITVINRRKTPFAVVKTGPGPLVSRVRLDSTFVRGAHLHAFELAEGPVEVVVNRSVIVSGSGPLLTSTTAEPGPSRSVYVLRSLMASGGSLVELLGNGSSGRAGALTIKSLGTTFARLEGGASLASLLSDRREPASGEGVAWQGHGNQYSGWSDWLSVGHNHGVRVADLAAARAVWPSTDPGSQETKTAGASPPDLDRAVVRDFEAVSPERRPTLARVASPSPCLSEKTVELFARVAIPGIRKSLPDPPPRPANAAPVPPPGAVPGASAAAKPAVATVRVLAFETDSNARSPDLGEFLREQIRNSNECVKVLIRGAGPVRSSPVRLPEGTILELAREPSTKAERPPMDLTPFEGSKGEALFELQGGALMLSDLRLRRDGSSALHALVSVNGGHLVIQRCRLMAPGSVETAGGSLIVFRSPGTQPLAGDPRPNPFESAPDRPICRLVDCLLITGGEAIEAELGRGLISLSNCAIASGSSAFTLRPAKVARSRFAADLWLDRCTVTAERNFVRLAGWSGSAPGPDRPWVVTSRDCAFLDNYDRPTRDSVFLRVEPDALAYGSLFWQANNDVYAVAHFTARSDVTPPNSLVDVFQQWVNLWGTQHVHNVTGFSRSGRGLVTIKPKVKFRERLRIGHVVPADLGLSFDYPTDRPHPELGADLARLGIALRPERGR